MVAYTYRMPAGIPGEANRLQECTIAQEVMDSAAPVTAFGVPVKMVGGKIQTIAASDAATVIYGLLVRNYPTQGLVNEALGAGTPKTSGICDVLKRGYMHVRVGAGTAAKNGVVYMRVANPAGGKPIGGIEAVADSTNTVIVANAYFMGPADASGNCEIAYNL